MATENLTEGRIARLNRVLKIIMRRITQDKLRYKRAIGLMFCIARGDTLFAFNQKQQDGMQHLMGLAGHKTPQELVNNALTLYEAAVDAAMRGEQIALFDEATKQYTILALPGLEQISHDIEGIS